MDALTVAVLNDCQLVVDGVAAMLRPYADRVRVVELVCQVSVASAVDVALYDTFAVESQADNLLPHLRNPHIAALAVFTWAFTPERAQSLVALGVRGVLAKHLDAAELVAALEAVHAGEVVVRGGDPRGPYATDELPTEEQSNPLAGHGLTAREAEVIALVALGLSNAEISARLYITANTLKSYIRSSYRKMGVQRRTQAVAWALEHSLRPITSRTLLDAQDPAGLPG